MRTRAEGPGWRRAPRAGLAALGVALLLAGCAVTPPAGFTPIAPTRTPTASPSPTPPPSTTPVPLPSLFVPVKPSTTAVITPTATPIPPAPVKPPPTTGCRTSARDFVRDAPGSGKTVALTFDDGPAESDPELLKILAANHVKATFFFTGANAKARPGIVKAVAAAGHQIAGHSWSHRYPRDTPWTVDYLTGQWLRTRDVLVAESGQRVCFVRPPGGYKTNVLASTRPLGLTAAMWSLDTLDWQQPGTTTKAATAAIVKRATDVEGDRHPIVLLHSGRASVGAATGYRGNTLAAVPKIIAWYRDQGYRFVTMDGRG